MLVLSRQRDETIMIGDDTEITIVDIRGDKVRLGISAPRHIQVHRKEVYDAIRRENTEASRAEIEHELTFADHKLRIELNTDDQAPNPTPKPTDSTSKSKQPPDPSVAVSREPAKRNSLPKARPIRRRRAG